MFKSLFDPKSVAVIGTSTIPGKLGYSVFKNLKTLGFQGNVFPINPKGGRVLETKVFKNIFEIKTKIDLAIIIVPAKFVLATLKECGEKGIKNIIIISAGFKEIGGEGVKREKEIKNLIKRYEFNLIGPNCLGILNTQRKLNASFAEGMPSEGNIALVSQSGAMAVAISDWAATHDLGFSKIVSLGNKAGIDEAELLEYLGKDTKTKVILMYLESIENGQDFMHIAKKVSQKKPIIILKSGTSKAGTQAISSHTGSLAGSKEVIKAAFKQCGIIQAETTEDLFNFGRAFSYQKPPLGKNVAIITNAGGPGIMATDAVEKSTLELSQFEKSTTEKLKTKLPKTANTHNPVDIIGDALSDRYKTALTHILKDKNTDSVIVLLTPQSMTEEEETADLIIRYSKKYPHKTILTSFMGGKNIRKAVHKLNQNNIPNFAYPSRVVRTLEKMEEYGKWLSVTSCQLSEDKTPRTDNREPTTGKFLPMSKVFSLLKKYNITVPEYKIAKTMKEAIKDAEKMDYPVVLKICSKEVVHKSDSGGILVNLKNSKEVKKGYNQIINNIKKHHPNAKIKGVAIQKMLQIEHEVIVGVKRDANFGPIIMFGLGGIYVEILKDVTFRVAPLSENDALEMIQEIKSIKLLEGARGKKPVNLNQIVKVICNISKMVIEHPEIQELDINPLIVNKEGKEVVAIDARILI